MTAINVVRMRVKPVHEAEFLKLNQPDNNNLPGMRSGHIIKTAGRSYCLVAEWNSMDAIVAARPAMIGILDKMRGLLEDLGGGLGVTDPVSGEEVQQFG